MLLWLFGTSRRNLISDAPSDRPSFKGFIRRDTSRRCRCLHEFSQTRPANAFCWARTSLVGRQFATEPPRRQLLRCGCRDMRGCGRLRGRRRGVWRSSWRYRRGICGEARDLGRHRRAQTRSLVPPASRGAGVDRYHRH
jgi:hypothetical protein